MGRKKFKENSWKIALYLLIPVLATPIISELFNFHLSDKMEHR